MRYENEKEVLAKKEATKDKWAVFFASIIIWTITLSSLLFGIILATWGEGGLDGFVKGTIGGVFFWIALMGPIYVIVEHFRGR